MDILSKMNAKMDQGYKVTNVYCQTCNGVTMSLQGKSQLYCPKCNKEYIPKNDQQEDETQQNFDDIIEEYNKKKNQTSKSQDVSKKIGQKLVQGWTMLDEACLQCNVPLMRSKKGAKICCGCGKDFAEKQKVEKIAIQPKKQEKKQRVLEKKSEVKKGGEVKQRIEGMMLKSIEYLEGKMDRAIEDNDINGVEKVLDLLSKVKEMI